MQQWLVGNTASLSFVWRDGVSPMRKDRGAEEGDDGGPVECSFSIGNGSG